MRANELSQRPGQAAGPLALIIFAEKMLPHGPRIATAAGAAFVALGILVASGALSLPGGHM